MLSLSDCNNHKIWNDFLAEEKDHQLITIAHNPSLGPILEKTFGYDSQNFLIKKDEKVVGVMPIAKFRGKLISLPHFSYGGPVMASNDKSKVDPSSLLEGGKFEIRSFSKLTDHVYDKKIISIVELKQSAEKQLMSLKSSFRRKIRSAEKRNLKTLRGGLDLLEDFYMVYSRKMLQKGSPPLGRDFFRNLLTDYENGEAGITALYDDGKVVAVGFTLSYMGFNELCWASTIRSYDKYNVNSLMFWTIIKDSMSKGHKYFSMGRSTINSNNHKYKRSWRPMELPIYYNYSEPQPKSIKEYSFLCSLWKYQPLPTSMFLGQKISKYVY